MTPDDDLRALATLAREKANAASATVSDLRRMLGHAMAAEAEANRAAREAEMVVVRT